MTRRVTKFPFRSNAGGPMCNQWGADSAFMHPGFVPAKRGYFPHWKTPARGKGMILNFLVVPVGHALRYES